MGSIWSGQRDNVDGRGEMLRHRKTIWNEKRVAMRWWCVATYGTVWHGRANGRIYEHQILSRPHLEWTCVCAPVKTRRTVQRMNPSLNVRRGLQIISQNHGMIISNAGICPFIVAIWRVSWCTMRTLPMHHWEFQFFACGLYFSRSSANLLSVLKRR